MNAREVIALFIIVFLATLGIVRYGIEFYLGFGLGVFASIVFVSHESRLSRR